MSFSKSVTLLLIACSSLTAGYMRRSTISFTGATGSTQTNITLASVTVAMNDLKDSAHGGVIQHATCTSAIANVPCDEIVTDDINCGAGATAFKWVFETYDGTAGTQRIWILIPSYTTAGITPYVCFGNSAVSTYQGGASAYDSNTKGAWPLPNGITLNLADFSSNANNGTGVNTPTAGTGKIDGAVSLASASTQSVNLGSSSTLNPAAETVEVWVNATSFPNAYNTVVSRINVGATMYQQFFITSAGKIAVYVIASGGVQYDGTGSHTLSSSTWYHVAWTYDSVNGLIGYVNGAQDGTASPNGALSSTTANAYIGNDSNTAGRNWNGLIDEVRISSVARSANWIATEYANQNSPPSMSAPVTLGTCTLSLLGVGC